MNEQAAAPAAAEQILVHRTKSGSPFLTFLQAYSIVIAAVLLIIAVAIGNPVFLSYGNICNLLSQWATAGIIAIGMTAVVIAGGFDLSIGSSYGLCAIVAATMGNQTDPWTAFVAAALVGTAVGVVNAVLITNFKISPFITTVGTGFIVSGVALAVAHNTAVIVSNPDFGALGAGRWEGIPYSGLLLIALMILAEIVLSATMFGHFIYAVGGNAEASRLSGIPVKLVVSGTYILLGACVGIAGFISASQINAAQTNLDPRMLFDVLTVVIVGGTSLGGGIGSIWRTATGLVIIATISNGFVLLDISSYYQDMIKGAIIVGALVMDAIFRMARKAA
jgi:ribose transport system permease protein